MAANATRSGELSEAAESSNPRHPSDDPLSVFKNLVDNNSAREDEILKIISSSSKDYMKLTNDWIKSRLRNDGYDAYACTTEWQAISLKGERHTATNSFVAIVDGPECLIVDLHFKSHFNVANPSEIYKSVQNKIPTIFVGNNEKLVKILSLISSVAQASMAAEDIPPSIREAHNMFSRWRFTNIVRRK